jgi:transcriptional regulator
MYKLPYFTEEDSEKVIHFMQQHSFAVVTGFGDPYPVASQLPLEIEVKDNELFLSGHLMKNTDHHKAFEQNDHVLVVFNGPHCYVSASWYTNPSVASTWNYMAVHAKGKIQFTDEEGTYKAIRNITNKYEGTHTEAAFSKLAPEYINRLTKAIVGFTIKVESIENVFKLSQNHEEATRKNIVQKLRERGDENSMAIAKEIELRVIG